MVSTATYFKFQLSLFIIYFILSTLLLLKTRFKLDKSAISSILLFLLLSLGTLVVQSLEYASVLRNYSSNADS